MKEMTKDDLDRMISEEEFDRALFALSSDDLEPLRLYLVDGILPGGFLQAVLSNDLCGALGRADFHNRRRVFEYVQWLYNNAPASAWGSPEFMSEYSKRMRSKNREHEAQ